MNTLKVRVWVLLLMLVCCTVAYTSATPNLPVANTQTAAFPWML